MGTGGHGVVAMAVSRYSGVCDSVHAREYVTVFLGEGHKMEVMVMV